MKITKINNASPIFTKKFKTGAWKYEIDIWEVQGRVQMTDCACSTKPFDIYIRSTEMELTTEQIKKLAYEKLTQGDTE